MPVTPLPTVYRGTTFRSRLEADWAATLDDRGIAWQYEPEGYRLTDGTYYAPDFWLPGVRAWFEVKGSHMERYSKIEQFARDLWAESGAYDGNTLDAPLIIVGRDPARKERLHGFGYFEAVVIHRIDQRGVTEGDIHFADCPRCESATFFTFGQDLCRVCGERGPDIHTEFFGCWIDARYLDRPFVRVPRDFGRRSA